MQCPCTRRRPGVVSRGWRSVLRGCVGRPGLVCLGTPSVTGNAGRFRTAERRVVPESGNRCRYVARCRAIVGGHAGQRWDSRPSEDRNRVPGSGLDRVLGGQRWDSRPGEDRNRTWSEVQQYVEDGSAGSGVPARIDDYDVLVASTVGCLLVVNMTRFRCSGGITRQGNSVVGFSGWWGSQVFGLSSFSIGGVRPTLGIGLPVEVVVSVAWGTWSARLGRGPVVCVGAVVFSDAGPRRVG